MKVYNAYLMVVAVALLLTTVVMAALEQTQLSAYFTLYVIEALVATELFVYFNTRARRGLNLVSAVLFGSFMVSVTLQILGVVG